MYNFKTVSAVFLSIFVLMSAVLVEIRNIHSSEQKQISSFCFCLNFVGFFAKEKNSETIMLYTVISMNTPTNVQALR